MQYLEALHILKEEVLQHSLATQQVDLVELLNGNLARVVAEDVTSSKTLPPFTNSAVDGFALKSQWTSAASSTNPVRFNVLNSLWPGEKPQAQTPLAVNGSVKAWAIMTGAPVPLDCDSCVKIEDTKVERDASGQIQSFELRSPVSAGENLRVAGDDFLPGQIVVSQGEVLRPEHLLALTALGIQTISVFAKPRVVLVPTGKELVAACQKLEIGQTYNSTQPFLRKSLELLGCEVESAPIMRDEPEVFLKFLENLKQNPPDLLLTTGAVSMGAADFIRPVLERAGAQILFHRLDIRPAKPILFAKWVSTQKQKSFVAFGLPGNPVSSVVGLKFFIEPYLRGLQKRPSEQATQMPLAKDFKKPAELRCFFKARTHWQEGRVSVEILKGQPSFMVHSLLYASSWAVAPEGLTDMKAGDLIDVFPQGFSHV
jgi:molybdopterin molybdotransferase